MNAFSVMNQIVGLLGTLPPEEQIEAMAFLARITPVPTLTIVSALPPAQPSGATVSTPAGKGKKKGKKKGASKKKTVSKKKTGKARGPKQKGGAKPGAVSKAVLEVLSRSPGRSAMTLTEVAAELVHEFTRMQVSSALVFKTTRGALERTSSGGYRIAK